MTLVQGIAGLTLYETGDPSQTRDRLLQFPSSECVDPVGLTVVQD
jgi:hypothetical protein